MENKKANKFQHLVLFFFTQFTSTLCWCIRNLKTLAFIGAEKSVTKIIREKERLDKGNDMHKDADSPLKIKPVKASVCTKFKNIRNRSFWEIFDKN